jgi:hypothetical protein
VPGRFPGCSSERAEAAMVIRAGYPRGAGPAMAEGPESDSRRVERCRQNAGRSIGRIPPGGRTVDNRDDLKCLAELSDHGCGLGTERCKVACAGHLGAGRGNDRSWGGGPLRHGAFGGRGPVHCNAQRGPDDGIELQDHEEGEHQSHAVE